MRSFSAAPLVAIMLAGGLAAAACGDAQPGGGVVQALRAPPIPDEVLTPEVAIYHPDLGINISEMKLHPSGVLWEDDPEGQGDTLDVDRTAVVHYSGWLPDGTPIDSSREGSPFTFRVGAGEVIDAWDYGVVGMRVGGKRKLVIPPDLGYGAGGFSIVPPNAILVFEIELLEIRP